MMITSISNEALNIATTLNHAGSEQLGNLIIGENQARLMTVAGLVMGENVIYYGHPGGAKSTLTENFYKIVHGIDAEDFADVPHRADLTGAQLVGDANDAVRQTQREDGTTTTEKISADIQAIITPDSKIVRFDEVNRLNTYTSNAALGILAQRKIQVRRQFVGLKSLEMVVSAMNQAETTNATFRLPHALASRQAMGVILGANDDPQQRAAIADEIWGGWEPTPERIQPVVSLDQLHIARDATKHVIVSDEMRILGRNTGLAANDVLTEMRVPEADGRINVQLSGITRTLALLRGRTSANEHDIHDAVDFTMTARLGAIGKDSQAISQVVSSLQM